METEKQEARMNDPLNREEREILEKFDRGELRPATGVEGEMTTARQVARSKKGEHEGCRPQGAERRDPKGHG